MNDLIDALIERGGLITPPVDEYYPSDTDYYTDDDLYALTERKFLAKDPSYEEQKAFYEQQYRNKLRDMMQTYQQPEKLDLDNYFREYNDFNNLTPFDY